MGTKALGTIQMNSSVFLFLLLLITNPAFAANSNGDEPNVSPKRVTVQTNTTQENDTVSTVPVAATRPTPIRSTRSTAPRTVSPRWHSMLPGMFR